MKFSSSFLDSNLMFGVNVAPNFCSHRGNFSCTVFVLICLSGFDFDTEFKKVNTLRFLKIAALN